MVHIINNLTVQLEFRFNQVTVILHYIYIYKSRESIIRSCSRRGMKSQQPKQLCSVAERTNVFLSPIQRIDDFEILYFSQDYHDINIASRWKTKKNYKGTTRSEGH